MATAHRMKQQSRPGTVRTSGILPKAEPIKKPVRVVIFEDCPEVLNAYSEGLKTYGFGLANLVYDKPVDTVDQAVAIFCALRPDVVITDLSFTGGNTEGYEVLRRIKEMSPKTPVGLSSSSYEPSKKGDPLVDEIRSQGFDALFHKADVIGICGFICQQVRP